GDRQMGDHGERPGSLPVPDVAVAVAASQVTVDPTPELGHDPLQVEALRELGGEVAMRDEERVVLLQAERDTDVRAFLSPAGVDRAGKSSLPVQGLHPL